MVVESDITFAPEYSRMPGGIGNKGIIEFPDDKVLRREVLPIPVDHPSKNNLYMYREICEYGHRKFGYKIFADPMAGGGSLMYGALEVADHIHLIELEDEFLKLLQANREYYTTPPIIHIHPGQCQDVLLQLQNIQDKVDMIVFSPPYSNQFTAGSGKGMNIATHQKGTSGYTGIAEFIKHPKNLSNLKEFYFNLEMEKVFAACYQALRPGGSMVIITKDRIENWKKVNYALHQVRQAVKAGFKPYLWEQHTHVGKAFGYFNLSKGYRQIQEEDIIFLRRE